MEAVELRDWLGLSEVCALREKLGEALPREAEAAAEALLLPEAEACREACPELLAPAL